VLAVSANLPALLRKAMQEGSGGQSPQYTVTHAPEAHSIGRDGQHYIPPLLNYHLKINAEEKDALIIFSIKTVDNRSMPHFQPAFHISIFQLFIITTLSLSCTE
jgi:hypothetical protein